MHHASLHSLLSIVKMGDSEDQHSSSHGNDETTPLLPTSQAQVYSIFTTSQKRLIILGAALASAFSPLSANIYYPALNSIAKDLGVTPSQVNLSITSYMVRCKNAVHTRLFAESEHEDTRYARALRRPSQAL